MRAEGEMQWSMGRYLPMEVLGEGSMGTVLRAYDPELRRDVAIKMVGAESVDEARAMAAVCHPNVVAIYDVGSAAEGVFLAMELVEGETLRQWLRTPRTWREIVAVFIQAGRGLAAVHELGVVHRDVKPDNVLVGRDGRVRVTDFGLATTRRQRASAIVAGTPAYMAPEQHDGGSVDARSDQFAFCVALHEALHGERPFRGRTLFELAYRKHLGDTSAPQRGHEIPRWLEAVIARGLSPDPSRRFRSMQALVGELREGLRRRAKTRRTIGNVGLAAALSTLAATAPLGEVEPAQPPGCLASDLPSASGLALASPAAFVSLPCTSPPPF
jgi:serine/threonine protein kinase